MQSGNYEAPRYVITSSPLSDLPARFRHVSQHPILTHPSTESSHIAERVWSFEYLFVSDGRIKHPDPKGNRQQQTYTVNSLEQCLVFRMCRVRMSTGTPTMLGGFRTFRGGAGTRLKEVPGRFWTIHHSLIILSS